MHTPLMHTSHSPACRAHPLRTLFGWRHQRSLISWVWVPWMPTPASSCVAHVVFSRSLSRSVRVSSAPRSPPESILIFSKADKGFTARGTDLAARTSYDVAIEKAQCAGLISALPNGVKTYHTFASLSSSNTPASRMCCTRFETEGDLCSRSRNGECEDGSERVLHRTAALR